MAGVQRRAAMPVLVEVCPRIRWLILHQNDEKRGPLALDPKAEGGQLSSRTLRVSTCCWNPMALPSPMVQTWAIFTTAGSPDSLCFHW